MTLSVLGTAESQNELIEVQHSPSLQNLTAAHQVLVTETTTLGVRVVPCERFAVQREMKVGRLRLHVDCQSGSLTPESPMGL